MANTFVEFDSTVVTLVRDLQAAILTSADWSDESPLTPSTTSTSAYTGGTATATIAVTSTVGFAIGMVIVIDPGPNQEFRQIQNVLPTSLSFANTTWAFSHASGVVVRNGATVLKATTTRGAEMVVDLAGPSGVSLSRLTVSVYRSWAAGVGADQVIRYLSWRPAGGAYTDPLHCVVAAGKEHLFFSVEGPRAGEPNADSATLGSYRQYLALCDLVPYLAADTVPAVVLAGYTGTATTDETPYAYVSRNQADTASWVQARMGTVCFPGGDGATLTPTTLTQQASDGNTYLFPYVVVENAAGLRGRLPILYAGYNASTLVGEPIVTPGALFTVDGVAYRAVGTHRGPTGNASWGPFGGGNTGYFPVIAVPAG